MTTTPYVSQQATYLQNLISLCQENCPQITDYSVGSVAYTLLSAVASVADEQNYNNYTARQQSLLRTATLTDLDNKANDYGIVRKQATAAQWVFTATKNTPSSQQITIPQGSLISTLPGPGQDPITFMVNQATTLPVGSTSVSVVATCTQIGSIGNIAINTPLVWGSAVPGIDGVTFNSTTGGNLASDRETDDQLRTRALAAFEGLAISTKNWYQSTAMSVQGVSGAIVVPQGRGPGTVDIYIVGANNSIPSNNLISTVQSTIDDGRVITDDAKVFAPSAVAVNASLNITSAPGYDHTATANQVHANITNYINNLGIGGGPNALLPASQLIAIAMGTRGCENVTTTFTDMTFTSSQLPQAGAITVS